MNKTGYAYFAIIFAALSALCAAETISVSIGEQPPLLSKEGGIVNLVVEEALSREGYTVLFDWLPIGRMLKSLEGDLLELYVTPSNTAGQQNPHVDFLAAKGVFFYMKSNSPAKPIKRLEDLAGRKVGTVTNSPLRPLFEKAGIIVDEGPFETMFLKLNAGRVDFVSTADVGGLLTIKTKFAGREAEFDFTDFSYTTIKSGLYAKPGPENERVLEAARNGLAAMRRDGSLSRMLSEFFGPVYAGRVLVY